MSSEWSNAQHNSPTAGVQTPKLLHYLQLIKNRLTHGVIMRPF